VKPYYIYYLFIYYLQFSDSEFYLLLCKPFSGRNIFKSLHFLIFKSPHLQIILSSHLLIITSSYHHIITSSYHLIITSSYHHIILSTHHHIISSPHHSLLLTSYLSPLTYFLKSSPFPSTCFFSISIWVSSLLLNLPK
jgi:hypothetical protein